jgi:hypothetical protein
MEEEEEKVFSTKVWNGDGILHLTRGGFGFPLFVFSLFILHLKRDRYIKN